MLAAVASRTSRAQKRSDEGNVSGGGGNGWLEDIVPRALDTGERAQPYKIHIFAFHPFSSSSPSCAHQSASHESHTDSLPRIHSPSQSLESMFQIP